MARKPIDQVAVNGRTPRERIWAAVRKMKHGDSFSLEVLIARQGKPLNADTVHAYMAQLGKAGYIERSTKGGFKLVRDTGVDAPRLNKAGKQLTAGLPRQQVWNAIRTAKSDWDFHEIAAVASTPACPVRPVAAANYVRMLAIAGYLEVTRPRTALPPRYRLLPKMRTGPKAPQVQRVDQVFDLNLGKVVYTPDPLEVADAQL